jgi:hypothetical protein
VGYQVFQAIGVINQYQDGLFGGSLFYLKYAAYRIRIKGIGPKSVQAAGREGDNATLSDNSGSFLNYIRVGNLSPELYQGWESQDLFYMFLVLTCRWFLVAGRWYLVTGYWLLDTD